MVMKCQFRSCLLFLLTLAIISFVYLYTNVSHRQRSSSDSTIKLRFESFESQSIKSSLICSGDPYDRWCKNPMNICNSSIVIFNRLFILTREIFLQPNLAKGQRKGGEAVKDVLNQPENIEYFQFEKGFIKTKCAIPLNEDLLERSNDNRLQNVLSSATPYKTVEIEKNSTSNIHVESRTTIAVTRYDYANLYHTITDMFTVYLLCRFFHQEPKSVRILFLDAHPSGSLDEVWSKLFHSYQRLGHMNFSSIFYRELIWSQQQSRSELDVTRQRNTPPVFFEDFRRHIIRQYNLEHLSKKSSNCEQFNIFFLIRRNYVAHPRNPTGRITRQLANERKVLDELTTKFHHLPSINFTSGYFEQASFREQLSAILRSDILVGIHGAGLTHVLFLQANRRLIELSIGESLSRTHFEQMAAINKIKYRRCSIINGLESTTRTIFQCITHELFQMCPLLNRNMISSTERMLKKD